MATEDFEAVRAASLQDAELAAALSATASLEEWVRVANERGFSVNIADVPALGSEAGELSEAELEGVSGGYTFARTDWVYCDNPWTDAFCTLKC